MPSRPPSPCAVPGCSALTRGGGRCPLHQRERHREINRRRPSAHAQGYNRRWRAYRLGYLAAHPLCVECVTTGRAVPATEVDHIRPHRGDQHLFWSADNHRALCKSCHSRATAKYDGGFGNARTEGKS